MNKVNKYLWIGALTAVVVLLASCDEEERRPYGGPWRIVKTPPEAGGTVKDIFFLDANTGWAAASKILLKWNGKEWLIQKKFVHPNPAVDYSIKPIWAFAEDDVWVAGGETWPKNEFHSKIWHFNGQYWEDVAHPEVRGIGYLWFNSPTDGWAMGGDYMLRWDGEKWTRYDKPYGVRGTGFELRCVFCLAENDVWAGGTEGNIIHFKGFGSE